ncbi:hypothetical protein B296_00005785 [Ensete ventricosum]|uniref:Uncharacterized protein n=1 Tax=Ensete ventricosum TaxID=4639 RepID=A0A427A787_ENSVE|nr:hypothetical protein B296_00005785 [Ensete ventricosum]
MSSPFRHRIGSASSVSTGSGDGGGGGSLGADAPNPSPSPIRDFLRQDPIFSAIPPPPLPPPPSLPLIFGRNTRDLRTDPKRSCIFVGRCRYSAAAPACLEQALFSLSNDSKFPLLPIACKFYRRLLPIYCHGTFASSTDETNEISTNLPTSYVPFLPSRSRRTTSQSERYYLLFLVGIDLLKPTSTASRCQTTYLGHSLLLQIAFSFWRLQLSMPIASIEIDAQLVSRFCSPSLLCPLLLLCPLPSSRPLSLPQQLLPLSVDLLYCKRR